MEGTFCIQVDDGKGGKTEQRVTVAFQKPSNTGKSACITLNSAFNTGATGLDGDGYVLVNQGKARQCAKVDWEGCAPNLGEIKEDDWVADYFIGDSKETKPHRNTTTG